MSHPGNPIPGQCERYTRTSSGNYRRCPRRAAVERNGQKLCYGCNVLIVRAQRDREARVCQ